MTATVTGVDPLIQHLFTPTTDRVLTSALPSRAGGTRSRAGNAMGRTRGALLDGARKAVAANGTRITMAQVANEAGVAKATLYNHFRTREDVLAALLADEITTLIESTEDLLLVDALAFAADRISASPLLRALRLLEPATAAALSRIDFRQPGWVEAAKALRARLAGIDVSTAQFVLRWLSGHILTPADRLGAVHGAELVHRALVDG
jgi:AcrR family transcriptional regulator